MASLFKRHALIVALSAGLMSAATVAHAADRWDGFYGGVMAGYNSTKTKVSDVYFTNTGGEPLPGAEFPGGGVNAFTIKSNGEVLGGTIGFNVQDGKFVWGIEADFSFGSKKGKDSTYEGIYGFTSEAKLKRFGTLRARAGVVNDRLLIYGTGGLAHGAVDGFINDQYDDPTGLVKTKDSLNMLGWTIGGGVEYMLSENWSIKGEYLYYDLGKKTLSVDETKVSDGDVWADISAKVKVTGSVARVGLNYRF